jgi:hypothetical protein
MASLVLAGDTSGSITVAAPAVAGSTTQTLVNVTGTLAPVVSGTAQTAPFSTNTRADFSSIPSWVKRVTVMLSGVGTSGTAALQIQLSDSTLVSSGYIGYAVRFGVSNTYTTAFSSAFVLSDAILSTDVFYGVYVLTLIDSNRWAISGGKTSTRTTGISSQVNGVVPLSSALTAVRVTTTNGTDTFDTGSIINILYE